MNGHALRRCWRHRPGDRYVVILASAVGNDADGFDIQHDSTLAEFPSVLRAKRYGFGFGRSDDFNIGAIRGGKLAAILWMNEITDDSPDVLERVAKEIGLS